jgi:hypothetical protein
MLSGWEKFVGDQDAFRGTDENGVYHFPGFGLDVVDLLLEERRLPLQQCCKKCVRLLDSYPAGAIAAQISGWF